MDYLEEERWSDEESYSDLLIRLLGIEDRVDKYYSAGGDERVRWDFSNLSVGVYMVIPWDEVGKSPADLRRVKEAVQRYSKRTGRVLQVSKALEGVFILRRQ
jgi:hypothetical protein